MQPAHSRSERRRAAGGRLVTAVEHNAPGAAWADTYARRGIWWGHPEELTRRPPSSVGARAVARATSCGPPVGALEPGVRVLEAGCGTGQYGLALALQGLRVDAPRLQPGRSRASTRAHRPRSVGTARTPNDRGGRPDASARPPTTPTTWCSTSRSWSTSSTTPSVVRRSPRWSARRSPAGSWSWWLDRRIHSHRCGAAPAGRGSPINREMVELDAAAARRRAAGRRSDRRDRRDGIAAWRALFFWPRWYERWS